MKYTKDSPVEIILGVCDKCNNYVPFMRLATEDEERVYAVSYTHLTLPTICSV